MSARSYLCGILHMLIAAMLTRELDTQDSSDSSQISELFPVFLPVSYKVDGADYLLLKEVDQDIMGNSSMQSHTQSLVILRVERPPVVTASHGSVSTEREIPLDLIQSVSLFPLSASVLNFIWKINFFVLTRRVHSSQPNVRVLFYVPGHELNRGEIGDWTEDELPCVIVYVYAFWQTQEVRGSCVISGRSGLCVATLEPPAQWFGPARGNQLELYYQTKPDIYSNCKKQWLSKVNYDPVTPMQRIGSVRLLQVKPSTTPDSLLRLGDVVIIQTSSNVVQINEITSFFVYVKADLDYFSLRVVMRMGVTFIKATPTDLQLWDVTTDAVSKDQVVVICKKQSRTSEKRLNKLQSMLQMDFKVNDVRNLTEVQVIKWELILKEDVQSSSEGFMKIYTTQKAFVGVAPLVTDVELINTAVLTGNRVMVPVRIVAVEPDGSVTDVTDFTDCNSTDEDVLKVSDRCNYVYVDGKETKGRVQMLVNFTYSYMFTQLEMKVWFPRFPLDIEISDTVLSPIKGWRIPINTKRSSRLSWSSEDKGRGCTLQFQHAVVRVLTHFVAEQSDSSEPQAYFLGSDWLVDITEMVKFFMKVEDPSVAQLQDGRVLSGQDFGITSIKVLSPLSNSILAEKSVSVVDERVSITELGLQLVSGLTLHLQLSSGSTQAISATATTQEVLDTPKQKAVLSSWLRFSDGSTIPLDTYDSTQYLLNMTSLDEAVVSIQDSPLVVEAQGEGGGVLVRAEMTIPEACQKKNRKSVLTMGNAGLTVKFRTSKGSTNNSVEMMVNGEVYGEEDEEQSKDVKEILKVSSSGSSEGQESSLRNITTTANDVETQTNNNASAEFSQSWNIFYNESPFRPNGNGSAENLRINEDTTGNSPGNIMNLNNSPVQVEVPIQEPKNNADADTKGPRLLTHLEIGMYALLSVFCLAILVFLSNCILHLLKFRWKQTACQLPEQTGHGWMWPQTDAQELILTDIRNGIGMGIRPNVEPCATQRTGCQVASVAEDLKCVGSGRSESPNSPTSKRKRVQFTTFALTDSQNSLPRENGHGIQWVGKEKNFVSPDVPHSDAPEQL